MIRIPDNLLKTKSNRSYFNPTSTGKELVLTLASSHSSSVRSVYTILPFMVVNIGVDNISSWQVAQVPFCQLIHDLAVYVLFLEPIVNGTSSLVCNAIKKVHLQLSVH